MLNNTSDKTIFVCGAGHQGLSMAAHLALNGLKVNLWNRTLSHIQKIIQTGVIHCNGIVNGDAKLERISSDESGIFVISMFCNNKIVSFSLTI